MLEVYIDVSVRGMQVFPVQVEQRAEVSLEEGMRKGGRIRELQGCDGERRQLTVS